MIKYFRDLLSTLRSIDQRLARLESCIRMSQHGSRLPYINAGHWNT